MSTQKEPLEVALTGVSTTTTAGSLFVSMRENLSVSHLLAAATFSRTVGSLQSEHAGEPFGAFWQDIQSHAIASMLTATAGLEAYANELFVDYAQVFPALPNAVMAKLWELYEMKSTLEKFDFALLLLGADPFDKSAPPHQDITALTNSATRSFTSNRSGLTGRWNTPRFRAPSQGESGPKPIFWFVGAALPEGLGRSQCDRVGCQVRHVVRP